MVKEASKIYFVVSTEASQWNLSANSISYLQLLHNKPFNVPDSLSTFHTHIFSGTSFLIQMCKDVKGGRNNTKKKSNLLSVCQINFDDFVDINFYLFIATVVERTDQTWCKL